MIDREYVAPAADRPRVAVGAADLGAYESTGAAAIAPVDQPDVVATDGTPMDTVGEPVVTEPATVAGAASGFPPLPDGAPALHRQGPDGADNGAVCPVRRRACCASAADGAYSSINAAIADAAAGDVIQVAGGTYVENVALGTFTALDPRNLTLLGGFSPDFAARDAAANPTVIDGGGDDPAVQLHVVSDGPTVLDGFVLTGGVGLGTDWESGEGSGGGVFAQQQGAGELVISHNEVYGNRTRAFDDDARGGGIHADAVDWDGGTPTVRIEHNDVHDNEAGRGAGIEVRGPGGRDRRQRRRAQPRPQRPRRRRVPVGARATR